jgi:hypothetical protein
MCDDCWAKRQDLLNPFSPVRLTDENREEECCCWCGQQTRAGIYVREDPVLLPRHEDHDG